ncbi:HIRAN domain-containing protein [Glutamicibacter sp. Je.9.36]|uniref:HIRAN domain-containing protein n=1 Tax=Glutamicibacter sp. Je.9.36 TaxID=3142837 RepID=UPI003DA80D7A
MAKVEPRNKIDPNAVKIMTLEGKKIGYLPAGLAKNYSPLIKQIGELRLDCRMVGIQLWMDVPHLVSLRKQLSS